MSGVSRNAPSRWRAHRCDRTPAWNGHRRSAGYRPSLHSRSAGPTPVPAVVVSAPHWRHQRPTHEPSPRAQRWVPRRSRCPQGRPDSGHDHHRAHTRPSPQLSPRAQRWVPRRSRCPQGRPDVRLRHDRLSSRLQVGWATPCRRGSADDGPGRGWAQRRFRPSRSGHPTRGLPQRRRATRRRPIPNPGGLGGGAVPHGRQHGRRPPSTDREISPSGSPCPSRAGPGCRRPQAARLPPSP
jgi:hypothetical protein